MLARGSCSISVEVRADWLLIAAMSAIISIISRAMILVD
jgi:hypothetical protein